MDVQRNEFYGMRGVLEGRDIARVIWKMIGESIEDAVNKYVVEDYVSACISDWAKSEFEMSFEPSTFKGIRRINDLEVIKNMAKNEIVTTVPNTLGEYLGEDRADSSQWRERPCPLGTREVRRRHLREPAPPDGCRRRRRCSSVAAWRRSSVTMCRTWSGIAPGFAARELCDWAESSTSRSIRKSSSRRSGPQQDEV